MITLHNMVACCVKWYMLPMCAELIMSFRCELNLLFRSTASCLLFAQVAGHSGIARTAFKDG